MDSEFMRADVALAARGMTPSREKARSLIDAGLVALNGQTVAKASQKVGPGDVLTLLGDLHPYVSRGGLKLAKALAAFDVRVEGLVCMDVGASTGGFTDVLLRNGARRVYAIDVGTGQLDPRLLADERVVSMEKVNARTLERRMFPEPPALAVMDVSFISIRLILPALFDVLGPSGRVCVDIGASTGGFTDVLLRAGARRVYAVDVGSGQLVPELAADPRVTSMEHVNARTLSPAMFPERPTLAVMDVSFISIKLILPAAFETLGAEGRMISLVKPQFEAGRRLVGKRGIVSDPKVHRQVLADLVAFAPTLGWQVRALEYSPIAGGDGNLEFLADMLPAQVCPESVPPECIDEVVRAAHAARL